MLRKLLDLTATSGEDRFRVTALFHDPVKLRLRYVALDIGGWLSHHEVLVGIGRMGAIDADAGTWATSLSHDEAEEAPRWSHHAPPADLQYWPPLIVGPFGGTYAPLLMEAAWAEDWEDPAEAAEEALPPDALRTRSGEPYHLALTNDWLGREAYGEDGLLGTIRDMELSEAPLTLTAAVIETAEGRETRLPLARLRRIADQGHAVFDARLADLAG